MGLQCRLHRGLATKTTPNLAFVLVSRASSFQVTPQGQQAELVRALKKVPVG